MQILNNINNKQPVKVHILLYATQLLFPLVCQTVKRGRGVELPLLRHSGSPDPTDSTSAKSLRRLLIRTKCHRSALAFQPGRCFTKGEAAFFSPPPLLMCCRVALAVCPLFAAHGSHSEAEVTLPLALTAKLL